MRKDRMFVLTAPVLFFVCAMLVATPTTESAAPVPVEPQGEAVTVEILDDYVPEPEPEPEPDPTAGMQSMDVRVTHYCTCSKCCGWSTGITASGRQAVPGYTIAVDPSIIPLGTTVLIDYGDGVLHEYRADDTGGAIKGAKIDVCMSTHQEALEAGVKSATVYW